MKLVLFISVLIIPQYYSTSTNGTNNIVFNRTMTGVHFMPFVKVFENDKDSLTATHYSPSELKTMLEVISTKFTQVTTTVVSNENRMQSITLMMSEAAALINRDHNFTKLNLAIRINIYDDSNGGQNRTAKEVHTALMSAKIANKIFPGTVKTFQISNVLSNTYVSKIGSQTMEYLRNQSDMQNISVGIHASLKDIEAVNNIYSQLTPLMRKENPTVKLIKLSDFTICEFSVKDDNCVDFSIKSFSVFSQSLLISWALLQRINLNMTIMGWTGWPETPITTAQDLQGLKDYWIEMNSFAVNHGHFMWLNEAIQNTGKIKGNMGWWRLTDEKLSHTSAGYIESIHEKVAAPTVSVNSDSTDMWHVIGIGVGCTFGGFIVVALLSTLTYMYHRINKLKEILTREEINEFRYGNQNNGTGLDLDEKNPMSCESAMEKPYDQSLEIPMEMLEIHWKEILGSGQFGCVYKATWKLSPPIDIALKTTKKDCPATALKGILSEIKILSHIGQHPNIVSICGANTKDMSLGRVYLATELCTMGSLKSFLVQLTMRETETPNGNYENLTGRQYDMFRWSHHIALGMEHLRTKHVIHADLATRNVLLTSDCTAKISDFGLSRRIENYSEYAKQGIEPLPWKWMAIESLRMQSFSHQSDVWSYGITLWEIFSLGAEPYPGLTWTVDFCENLKNGMRLQIPALATAEIYELMVDCWNTEPGLRPMFYEICNRVLKMFNN